MIVNKVKINASNNSNLLLLLQLKVAKNDLKDLGKDTQGTEISESRVRRGAFKSLK